jgi:hypothetical protein
MNALSTRKWSIAGTARKSVTSAQRHAGRWQRNKNNYSPAEKRKVEPMDQHALVAVGPSYRNVGMAAIASGVIGIAASGLLMYAVLTRVSWIPSARIYMLFNAHDIGVALQFLLLISVAFGLRTLSR